MQTKHLTKIVHPWLLGVSLLVVGIFMGAGIQVMRAQTASFTDPTCNPGEACNPNSTPILTTSTSTQTVSSPLTLNGDITLGAAYRLLKTGTTVEAINVSSSGNYSIIGSTSSDTHAGIYGKGTAGNASGVYGSTVNGNAIYGKVISGTGLAGFFEGNTKLNGNVQIGVATAPGVLAVPGSLTIANGNLTVSGKTTTEDIAASGNVDISGILAVNGVPVVGGGDVQTKAFMVNIPGTTPTATNITLTANQLYGTGKQYRMLGYTAFRMLGNSGTVTPRTWSPVVSGIIYTECTPPNYTGSMLLPGVVNNPVAYRVVITYKTEIPNCATANTDYEAPTVSIATPIDGANVTNSATSTVTVNAADQVGGGVTKLELYINGILVKTNNGTPASTTFTGVDLSVYQQSPPKISLFVKAYDSAGHVTTSAVHYINIVSSLCSPSCNPSTQECVFRGCESNPNDWVCVPIGAQPAMCIGGPIT